ncbi:hypothetical protein ZIOFF_018388 [Zingiber officinale]|uniref:Uncharacterized protein n=1 Tax=Zingiber officinale TaxID=94328 RepID=A0A8J5LAW2_ZINOF|nr:hypothetical protein ZIOFF_018388 [Zingiber officinale]
MILVRETDSSQVREKIMIPYPERRRKEKLGGRRNQKRLQLLIWCLEDAQTV